MRDYEVRKFALEMAVKTDPANAADLASQFYAFLTTRPMTADYSQPNHQTYRASFQPSQNWAKP